MTIMLYLTKEMQIPMWDLPIAPENRTAQQFREDLLYHDNVEKGGIVLGQIAHFSYRNSRVNNSEGSLNSKLYKMIDIPVSIQFVLWRKLASSRHWSPLPELKPVCRDQRQNWWADRVRACVIRTNDKRLCLILPYLPLHHY